MQRVLSRRIGRELKKNFFRYLALFLLIAAGMYIIVAMVGAAETVIRNVERGQAENCLEDGQFSVFVPLSAEELARIEEAGVTLEKSFFMDYRVGESTLRIYENRRDINLFSLSEVRTLKEDAFTCGEGYLPGEECPPEEACLSETYPLSAGEIYLEKHYAAANGFDVGDSITVGSQTFTVAGLGSTPDYDAVLENMSDSAADSEQFGVGFVTAEDYKRLREAGESFKTEEYCYSYRLNGSLSDEELKNLLQSFELDRSQVTDIYFLEMLEDAEESKNDMLEGIQELADGSGELSRGLSEITEHNEDLQEAADSLFDAMLEEVNAGFEEEGIGVVLQGNTFERQLDAMTVHPERYSGDIKISLRDAKETLEELQEFKDGVKEYTDGVQELSLGSGELCGGLTELTENSAALNGGAEQIFQAALAQANGQLAALGLPLSLTADGFAEELEQGIAEYGAYDAQLAAVLAAVREQLSGMADFRDGVNAYTGGTAAASLGSQKLTHGLSVLYTANDSLKEGTASIFDAMLETVNEQLEESDIEVHITEENFEAELERLTAAGSPVDDRLKKSLADSRAMLLDLQNFQEGIAEYTDGVREAYDGSLELADGIEELQDKANDMMDEFFSFDIDNLTAFVPAKDNSRIGASADDVRINKVAGMAAGVIIMILFAYVISVFVVHGIEQESGVIGVLYALGVKRRQLMLHYLVLPVIVSFFGGIAGCALGFSPMGADSQMASTVLYFSMPELTPVYPGYLLVYGLVMPALTAAVVNYFVIGKKLKRTALSLMRGEGRTGRIRQVRLEHLGFAARFQIRQLLRELRSALAILGGMFICLLVMMIALNCAVLCENFRKAAVEETAYGYLYTYKYPTKEAPEGGAEAYLESLNKTAFGYRVSVSVLGLSGDNPYFDVAVSGKQNEIVISSAVASKFSLGVGESLVLSDDVNDRDYAFTVIGIVPHNSSLEVYMELDAMRELFGREEDYYNAVFSEEPLDIDSGRLYATVSRESIAEAAEIFSEMMWPMVIMLTAMAALIFLVVLYLMIKVMIDRSVGNISLMKVFGYRRGEVGKLYLDGNLMVIVPGAAVCLFLSKRVMDALYPYFISNIAIGLDIAFDWRIYAVIYAAIMGLYLIISRVLVKRIDRISPAEILKNRE